MGRTCKLLTGRFPGQARRARELIVKGVEQRRALSSSIAQPNEVETLQRELERSRRTRTPVSVIMFDLDGFKGINDTAGHLKGDAVLASVGAQLGELLRSTDMRCRYGGDEFLLILPDTPARGAEQVAAHLRQEIAAAPRDEDGLTVTASIGVASARPGELDVEGLIGRADAALYRSKHEGRNRYSVSRLPGPVPVALPARTAAVAAG